MNRLHILFCKIVDMLMEESLRCYQNKEEWLSMFLYKLDTTQTELEELGIHISFEEEKENLSSMYPDVNAIYKERQKRFLRFWNQEDACEGIIETSPGEISIIIDALADYSDGMVSLINKMKTVDQAFWLERMRRIKGIQKKWEQAIGYDRDKQLEKCRHIQSKKKDDIGSGAMENLFRTEG